MPRFIVSMCDTNTRELSNHVAQTVSDISAVLSHPWVQTIYNSSYISHVLRKETYEDTVNNMYEVCGWIVSCENLDTAIMNALNGGDSSVSSNQLQE